MLCESRLWTVAFCQDWDRRPSDVHKCSPKTTVTSPNTSTPSSCLPASIPTSPWQPDSSLLPSSTESAHWRPVEGGLGRHVSPGVDVPGRAGSPGTVAVPTEPFLVPPSCHSICQHYSDLHIAGDQVLLLGGATTVANTGGDVQASLCQDFDPEPLVSCVGKQEKDEAPPLGPREGPSLLAPERPLSNSQLNRYLEQKLLELYHQHLAQGAALAPLSQTQQGQGDQNRPGPLPVLASELLQTSLDQITLQLRRRDHNLEASRAKDMVMSCLLRVASSLQSSEISTPLLQFSTDTAAETDQQPAVQQDQHPITAVLH